MLLISLHAYDIAVDLKLEQSGVLYVCHGGAMSVMCSTNASLLQWNITLLHNDPLLNQRIFTRDLSYVGTAVMAKPISLALTTLNVSRSLNNNSTLPLVSMISTDNATADLNGTIITCLAPGTLASNSTSVEIFLVGNTDNIDSEIRTLL